MKIMLLLSGGVDSSTLLYRAVSKGHSVSTITFDYGQRHLREIESAKRIANAVGVPNRVVCLPVGLFGATSSLTANDIPVPHGHYADKTMALTVVPGRNLLFSVIAAIEAVNSGYDSLGMGIHAGDHPIYPDCRPLFCQSLQDVLSSCEFSLSVWTPFLHWTKKDIVNEARKLAVPLELTWTCYEGQEVPCGKCGACVERNEAQRSK